MDAPTTAEAFFALPEAPAMFGMTQKVIDGKTYSCPVIAAQPQVFWVSETTPRGWTDENGIPWTLERHADGQWYRRRPYVGYPWPPVEPQLAVAAREGR